MFYLFNICIFYILFNSEGSFIDLLFYSMRNIINIFGNEQRFSYLIEYINGNDMTDGQYIKWQSDKNNIYVLDNDTKYIRKFNEWYNIDLSVMNNDYIPYRVDTSKIRIYIPNHSVDAYKKNVKYILTANTWVNGKNINLGSTVFNRIDTLAADKIINNGNNQYYEYFDMDIVDPYNIIYSDDWDTFRKIICNEPSNVNNTGALLNVSLYIVEENDNKYIITDDFIGGYTTFNICNESTEFLQVKLTQSFEPLGWKFDLIMNSQYDWLLTYLNETYGINVSHNDITYEIVLQSNDSIIPGPIMKYNDISQIMSWENIKSNKVQERQGFYNVFKSWDNFEEGWFIVGSLNVTKNNEEIISVVSNKIPLTQEVFKYFVDSKRKLNKFINPSDMEIINYNVINKIENTVVQLERPDNSKSNIIQPIFFKVKDTEKLTLNPDVTENICINLDDYKSKVKLFKLQIEGCIFEQIGVNQYGVLFKVIGTALPNKITEGTYYILNEDYVLVTTGKYKYNV